MLDTSAKKPPAALFSEDTKTALQAISHAQLIAFAPYVFQASVILRDSGILKIIEDARNNGISIKDVAANTSMSYYSVRILMEAGLGIGLLYKKDDKYYLAKTGHFFLNDAMTRVNADFMRDVCYDGAQDLKQSLEDGKPHGLRHLGQWETIYQGLSILPEPANKSWFAFDHYYSDNAFQQALPVVFEGKPRNILDIGGNTGKWTMACLGFDAGVHVGIVDLPVQLAVAEKNVSAAGYTDRVTIYPQNILDSENKLPGGYDVIWMSQFLDCFADAEITTILKKCHDVLPDNGSIFINELFWDRQRFEASGFSLQMTSLYFTTMANGNSQMYDSTVFIKLVHEAGFEVVRQMDNIGMSHTLLELKKNMNA